MAYISAARWRILADETVSFWGIAEFDMLDGDGNSVIPLTPNLGGSASSVYPNYPASKAFDQYIDYTGGFVSEWFSATGGAQPHWLEYNFGLDAVPTTPEVVEVVLKSSVNPADAPYMPLNFFIQYHDGSSWVTLLTVNGEPAWSASETRTYTVQTEGGTPAPPAGPTYVSADKWRILANEVKTYYNVCELEFLDADGIATVPAPANLGAISSSDYPGSNYPASGAFNDILVSGTGFVDQWFSNTTPTPHWIGYDFTVDTPSASPEVVTVRITASTNAGNMPYMPQNFFVQYWDGADWVTIYEVSGESAWSTEEVRSWTIQTAASGEGNVYNPFRNPAIRSARRSWF